MPMEKVSSGEALAKTEFHRRLNDWLDETDDATIGKGPQGQTGWVYVRDGDRLFKLNSDCTRAAAKRYLDLVSLYGDGLEWKITTSKKGNLTALLLGPENIRYESLPLYFVKAR